MQFIEKVHGREQVIELERELLTTFDAEELLNIMATGISRLLDAQETIIYLVDSCNNKLISQTTEGNEHKQIVVQIDNSSIVGHTAVVKKGLSIKAPYSKLSAIHPELTFNSPYDETSEIEIHSIITHPLVFENSVIGVFQLINRKGGVLNANDQALLHNFSLISAIAIVNTRLIEEVMETIKLSSEVIENTSDMIFTQNSSGMILYANQSVVDYLNEKLRDINVIGKNFYDIFPEFSNISREISRVSNEGLKKYSSDEIPAFVVFIDYNLNQQIEKITLIIKKA